MFAVTKKSRKLGLPVDIQFKIFDVMVVSYFALWI